MSEIQLLVKVSDSRIVIYILFIEKVIAVFNRAVNTLYQQAETVCVAIGRMKVVQNAQ